ncbi:vgr related protein [Sphingomonas sp. ID0503]|uniref:vgr related protein n=1 Tax=Sphingomonas sp. ID0503 TaxID=3399691 RepID=UPI003AFB1E73
MFGDAIDYVAVRVHRRRWWPLQPKNTCMAPDGHLWLPEDGHAWRDDYAAASPAYRALFVHEMTHVWQAQHGGRWFLPLIRHPFCRYDYVLTPGKPFRRYGIEQQAEIVKDAWMIRAGLKEGRIADYAAILPFAPFR